MSASIWSPDGTIDPPVTLPDYIFKRIWVDITAGQTLVNFSAVDPTFIYTPGLHSLEVGLDGLFPFEPGVEYLETSPTSITFTAPATDAGRLYACVGRPVNPSLSGLGASLISYIFPDTVVRNVQDLATFRGASGIGYTGSNTGEKFTTQAAINAEEVCILRFTGVDPTGVLDSTAAMAAAHATGYVIYYPRGRYKFTKFSFSQGGIRGDGRDQTFLISTDTSSDPAIQYVGSQSTVDSTPLYKDFCLLGPQSAGVTTKASGGSGLAIDPPTSELGYFHLRNVTFAFWPVCADFVRASYWSVQNCQFLAYTEAGLQVANENNPDSGDGVVNGNLFLAGGTTGEAILQKSSGGLKITGNKMLGGNTGFTLRYNSDLPSGVLVFTGNSVENMTSRCIALTQDPAFNGNFSNTVITGNEFAVSPVGIQTDARSFLSNLTISGNVFNLIDLVGGVTMYGIDLATVTDFNIGGNVFKGNGGTVSGIVIAASCTNGKIGKNTYATLTNTLLSSSTTTWVEYDAQFGTSTSSAVGWAGFGALFVGPVTSVTFPTPFTVAPVNGNIIMNVSSTNGACGYIITSISTTGFNYLPISSVNAIAAAYTYVANGII